jgi:hypothetical protein
VYSYDRHELFGGGVYRLVATNNPEFPRDSVWDAYNMVYERSKNDLEKMKGYSQLGTNTVGDVVSGLFDYDEGTKMVAASEDGGIYIRTTGDWSAATGGGASTFSTVNNTRWSGTMFYGATTAANILVLCNGVNAPQKFVSSTVSALGGSPPSTGKFPTTFNGRLWMASGDTLYYSAADNAEDWSSAGGSFQIDRGSGPINGLYNFAGNLIIFKRNKILRMLPGTTLASTSVRDLTSIVGASSHHTIKETTGTYRSGSLMFESDEGIQEIVPTSSTGGFFIRSMAEGIKPILDSRDVTNRATNWAEYNPSRGEYWLQYTIKGPHPDVGVIGNVARDRGSARWTTHDMRGKTAGMMYLDSSAGNIQVIGESSGKVYQMHSTDSRNDAGFRGFITTASFVQGDRSRMKKYGRVYIDAETDGEYPLQLLTMLGRSELPSPHGQTNQPSGFGSLDGWGVGLWGKASWGGSTVPGKWVRPENVTRGTYMRITVLTLGAEQWFRLNGLQIEYSMRRHILAA